VLEAMLARLQERGLLKTRGRQRTDSTHILAAVRSLNRFELVGRTLQHTLNSLAEQVPQWIQTNVPRVWLAFIENTCKNRSQRFHGTVTKSGLGCNGSGGVSISKM
jgi:transposase